jgi:diguanylate cyclase (GGDEF)-like protein
VKSPAESLNFRQSLLEFLEAGPGHEETLLEEFERKKGHGDPLYSSLLYLLTHLNFTERQAARHWKRVIAHRDAMRVSLKRDPGLRVAILDYFVNVSHELKNPKVIELAIYERTERSAVTDGLTGLYNHVFFLQALRQEVLRSKRHGLRAALLLLDLDDFKEVNDAHGHRIGDQVLAQAAERLRSTVEGHGTVGRIGGDEFVVIVETQGIPADQHASQVEALAVAAIDALAEELEFPEGTIAVGASVGIADWVPGRDADALISAADRGVYQAKRAGRCRWHRA